MGTMSVIWYGLGDSLKVTFRKHYCYTCKSKLSVVQHQKVVNPKSEEAKYYNFQATVGPCEFIHKVFFCSQCKKNIEFVTQISLEDIDIINRKVEAYFAKHRKRIIIRKIFQTHDGTIVDSVINMEDIEKMSLMIIQDNREIAKFDYPRLRMEMWERPYYFKVSKRKLIKEISDYCAKE